MESLQDNQAKHVFECFLSLVTLHFTRLKTKLGGKENRKTLNGQPKGGHGHLIEHRLVYRGSIAYNFYMAWILIVHTVTKFISFNDLHKLLQYPQIPCYVIWHLHITDMYSYPVAFSRAIFGQQLYNYNLSLQLQRKHAFHNNLLNNITVMAVWMLPSYPVVSSTKHMCSLVAMISTCILAVISINWQHKNWPTSHSAQAHKKRHKNPPC